MENPHKFRQSQISYWVLIVLPILIIALVMPVPSEEKWVAIIFGSALPLVIFLLFYRMTVSIDEKEMVIRFGIGLIKKRVQMKDVQECRPARSTFWMGWGIRLIPNGWLYNCHGYDALELVFKTSTRVIWVGTPDISALKQAVEARIGK